MQRPCHSHAVSSRSVCGSLFLIWYKSEVDPAQRRKATKSSTLLARASAGVIQSIIACPTELIKLRMQTQAIELEGPSLLGSRKYIGPLQIAKRIYKSGGIRALNKEMQAILVQRHSGIFCILHCIQHSMLCVGRKQTSGQNWSCFSLHSE